MIGNISSYTSRFNLSSYAASRAHNTGYAMSTQRAAQPQTPVEPVQGVGKMAPETQAPKSFGLSIREGADPVEMAVRMRIKYVEDPQELQPSGNPEEKAVESQQELQPSGNPEKKVIENQKELQPLDEPEEKTVEQEKTEEPEEDQECQTCEKRKYQDGSTDPGVSFKTPGHIDPEESAATVRGHEMEHVVNNRAKAMRENREIISQSVTLSTAICPECGTVYTSGGTTRTVFSGKQQPEENTQQPGQDGRVPFSAVA